MSELLPDSVLVWIWAVNAIFHWSSVDMWVVFFSVTRKRRFTHIDILESEMFFLFLASQSFPRNFSISSGCTLMENMKSTLNVYKIRGYGFYNDYWMFDSHIYIWGLLKRYVVKKLLMMGRVKYGECRKFGIFYFREFCCPSRTTKFSIPKFSKFSVGVQRPFLWMS